MLIKILDKEFRPYISSERLAQEIKRLAQEVEQQMQGGVQVHQGEILHKSPSHQSAILLQKRGS